MVYFWSVPAGTSLDNLEVVDAKLLLGFILAPS